MTKEDEKATLAALLEEKRGYELRRRIGEEQAASADPVRAAEGQSLIDAMDARLGDISSQLRALGQGAKPKRKQATQRQAKPKTQKGTRARS